MHARDGYGTLDSVESLFVGGPMFIDFVGHHYPQINIYFLFIFHNYYPNWIIYQILRKLCPNKPVQVWLAKNIDSHKLKQLHSIVELRWEIHCWSLLRPLSTTLFSGWQFPTQPSLACTIHVMSYSFLDPKNMFVSGYFRF